MTQIEELRKGLDECLVKYTETIVTEGVLFTVVTGDGYYCILVRKNNAGIEMWSQYLTPAQAIAATVGEEGNIPETKYQMTLDELREAERDAERWERIAYDHVSLCKSLMETNADLRRIIKETRAATVGAGTTRVDETDTWDVVRDDLGGYGKRMTVHVMECERCGRTYEHVNGDYEHCPRCGARIEASDES